LPYRANAQLRRDCVGIAGLFTLRMRPDAMRKLRISKHPERSAQTAAVALIRI
jgi:hypothetical protein